MPTLEPGKPYLLDVVVRTVKMGHPLTQGTVDSNEIWLDLVLVEKRADGGERIVGRSGGLGDRGGIDPWSHFFNVYMLDRNGKRIDRRNAEDIFVPLYNHKIPPGAADTLHYGFTVPADITGTLRVEARVQYRKFDTIYMHAGQKEKNRSRELGNDLPIMTMAADQLTFPVRGVDIAVPAQVSKIDEKLDLAALERLRHRPPAQGRQIEGRAAARPSRPSSKWRRWAAPTARSTWRALYILQGTVQDKAIQALQRATGPQFAEPARPWSVAWFTGQVNKQNGFLDEAIANFRSVVELDDAVTRERGYDFCQDYMLLNELGQTLFERAKMERGEARKAERERFLRESAEVFEKTLTFDSENAAAHYNLDLVYRQLGDAEKAASHLASYRRYKDDDNNRDRAVAIARAADPAANHSAEAIVIYDLQRAGAFELGGSGRAAARFELKKPPAADAPNATPKAADAAPAKPVKVADTAPPQR